MSETTWQTIVEQYKEQAKRDCARIDELRQSTEHWHDTAQMLKRQRDMAEEERDSWKIRAMQSEQQRQALRAEVVELREDRDSQKLRAETAERDRQIIRKNMDDLIVNVNVAMAERERALRAERDALRNYVEEKLNITKLTRLHGEELDRYILALVNAEANCEALRKVDDAMVERAWKYLEIVAIEKSYGMLSGIDKEYLRNALTAAMAVQPTTGGADE